MFKKRLDFHHNKSVLTEIWRHLVQGYIIYALIRECLENTHPMCIHEFFTTGYGLPACTCVYRWFTHSAAARRSVQRTITRWSIHRIIKKSWKLHQINDLLLDWGLFLFKKVQFYLNSNHVLFEASKGLFFDTDRQTDTQGNCLTPPAHVHTGQLRISSVLYVTRMEHTLTIMTVGHMYIRNRKCTITVGTHGAIASSAKLCRSKSVLRISWPNAFKELQGSGYIATECF